MLVVAVCLLCYVLALDAESRGYPLFFGSFEDVGAKRIETQVLSLEEADKALEDWLRGCKADAFVLIRDPSPFDISELNYLKRLAENSLTIGSLLTDNVLDTFDLAKDLEDYCDAELLVANFDEERPVKHWIDTRPRVVYADLENIGDFSKDSAIRSILGAAPTPYVTVVYTSTYQQQRPILRSVKLDQRRLKWKKQHNPENVVPIIAPLIDRKNKGHDAPEPTMHLPDNFFFTLLFGSLVATVFLVYRDFRG